VRFWRRAWFARARTEGDGVAISPATPAAMKRFLLEPSLLMTGTALIVCWRQKRLASRVGRERRPMMLAVAAHLRTVTNSEPTAGATASTISESCGHPPGILRQGDLENVMLSCACVVISLYRVNSCRDRDRDNSPAVGVRQSHWQSLADRQARWRGKCCRHACWPLCCCCLVVVATCSSDNGV
jgi:hypothetical protein